MPLFFYTAGVRVASVAAYEYILTAPVHQYQVAWQYSCMLVLAQIIVRQSRTGAHVTVKKHLESTSTYSDYRCTAIPTRSIWAPRRRKRRILAVFRFRGCLVYFWRWHRVFETTCVHQTYHPMCLYYESRNWCSCVCDVVAQRDHSRCCVSWWLNR